MKLLFSTICEHASQAEDGKLDVQGVFYDLYAPGFPAQQASLVLVLVLEWDPGDQGRYDFQADLVDPQGKPALTVKGQSEVSSRGPDRPPARTQLIMPMEDVVFPYPGEYTFRVSAKGKTFVGPTLYLVETPEAAAGPVEA